jgi:hypothetical protein
MARRSNGEGTAYRYQGGFRAVAVINGKRRYFRAPPLLLTALTFPRMTPSTSSTVGLAVMVRKAIRLDAD